jgi:hypothetical protein
VEKNSTVADMESIAHKRFFVIAVVGIAATAAFANLTLVDQACAAPAGPHHSFLGGPWEIVVKMGLDSEGLHFPLSVSDENKPQKLDAVLPIKGTPIEIRLKDYVPDLKWQTDAIQHPGGEIAAKLHITGKNLKQDIWLSSGDPARQSISSRIGGVAVRRIHDHNSIEALMRNLTHPRAVGILSVWSEDGNRPFEYVAKTTEKTSIPGSKYKLTVVEYMPHYSIDTETKKVVNQSENPVNPAVKVAVYDGKKTVEQWLWAKFPSSPHEKTKLPLRIRFSDFDLRGAKGKHILVVASGTTPWLLLSKNGKKRAEKVVIGRSYPFADKEYAFTIEKIMDGAIVKTEWTNGSETLLRPAVIATIKQNSTSRRTVLELNKPFHYRIKSGMLVLLYRRSQASSG